LTTIELAEAVGINPISVRHHLTNLQKDTLVNAEEERHGVGRPRLVYFLTENGLEKFPTRYLRLTSRLLTQIKDKFKQPIIGEILKELAWSIASEHASELTGLRVEERLDLIKKLLVEEGFVLEWEKQGPQYLIHEISCPYLQIGQNHPEICTVDQTLLSTLLNVPVKKIQCILNGANQCTYAISSI